ncbi:MAG: hypothetical protein WBA93_21460 [Microcoleaceae cyanobacterium]
MIEIPLFQLFHKSIVVMVVAIPSLQRWFHLNNSEKSIVRRKRVKLEGKRFVITDCLNIILLVIIIAALGVLIISLLVQTIKFIIPG